MPVRVDLVSVGTLSRNRFWGELGAVRAAHASTTLIRDDDTTVLVDPSLPGRIVVERLDERTGLKPAQVDAVFLTNFRPIHRRGLEAFKHADWLMDVRELQAMADFLEQVVAAAEHRGEPVDDLIRAERALLRRIKPAPDRLSEHIHLFPTPGVTPGAASLLALQGARTIAICGDAIINQDYFNHRQAFEQHSDAAGAVRSIAELCEIADIIVPGHGDWILNAGG